MSSVCPVALIQDNNEKIRVQLYPEGPGKFKLVDGVTVEMYIQAAPTPRDRKPPITLLSTATGEIAVEDAESAVCLITVPSAITEHVGRYSYWVDVIGAGGTPRITAIYRSPLQVEPR